MKNTNRYVLQKLFNVTLLMYYYVHIALVTCMMKNIYIKCIFPSIQNK